MGNAWGINIIFNLYQLLVWTEGCQGFDKKNISFTGDCLQIKGSTVVKLLRNMVRKCPQVQETTDLVEGLPGSFGLVHWLLGWLALGTVWVGNGATWNIQKDEQVDVLIQQVDDLNIFRFYILSNSMVSLATFWPSPGWLSDTPTFGVRLVWHWGSLGVARSLPGGLLVERRCYPCWLMIIGDYTTQYIRDSNNPRARTGNHAAGSAVFFC